eukprot:GHVS01011970.1.p1 GENE.GHVS01011970.1~~GHVS01011970.1.p1  ORF type:complete len:239 (-),score=30.12 GHVS01011970.1:384-1100(-)
MASYGKSDYWDERYTKDPEPFEWYQRYSGIKDVIASTGIQHNQHILMIGCGNSTLSEDMYNDGFKDITNIDISAVAIKAMNVKYSGQQFAGMTYNQMNCLDMTSIADQSFPVVLDKGTLDSILCGEGSTSNVQKMLREISRVLEPGGLYICVSYGQPAYRLSYLQRDELEWAVKIQTVHKPSSAVSAALTPEEADSVHYVYICRKQRPEQPTTTTAKSDSIVPPVDVESSPPLSGSNY